MLHALGTPAADAAAARTALGLGVAFNVPTAYTHAAVQAAIAATPAGGVLHLEQDVNLSGGQTLVLAQPITVRLRPGITITQQSYPYPVFDVSGDHVRIEGADALLIATAYPDGTRPDWDATSLRGGSRSSFLSGVWASGNYGYFDVNVEGFTCGVNLTNADNVGARTSLRIGNKTRIKSRYCDFGLVYTGQDRLEVISVEARNTVQHTGAFAPPHAVYGSGFDGPYGTSTSVTIGPLYADGTSSSFAFVFKFHDGLTIGDVFARNHPGLIYVYDCKNVTVGNGVMTNPTGEVIAGAVFGYTTSANSDGLTVASLRVDLPDTDNVGLPSGVSITGNRVRVGTIRVRHTITGGSDSAQSAVALDGTDIVVEDIAVDLPGAPRPLVLIGAYVPGTSKVHVKSLRAGVWRSLVHVNAACTEVLVDVDPDAVGARSAYPAVRQAGGVPNSTCRVRPRGERAYTTTGSALGTGKSPDPTLSARTWYTITDGTAGTVAAHMASSVFQQGLTHEVWIENATAGALGAISWNAAWGTVVFTAPAAGEASRVQFRFNGTAWAQVA